MFTPNELPCDAWTVTRSLRIKKVRIVKPIGHYDTVESDTGSYYFPSELHRTQTAAIGAAMAKVEDNAARVERAIKRLEQHKKNVNAAFLAAQEGGAA